MNGRRSFSNTLSHDSGLIPGEILLASRASRLEVGNHRATAVIQIGPCGEFRQLGIGTTVVSQHPVAADARHGKTERQLPVRSPAIIGHGVENAAHFGRLTEPLEGLHQTKGRTPSL